MNNIKFIAFICLIFCASQIFISCKPKLNKVEIDRLGLSMSLPKGWQVDSKDASDFYESTKPDDNLGWVTEYELEDSESLNSFVDTLVAEEQAMVDMQKKLLESLGEKPTEQDLKTTQVISRVDRIIDGHPAIELVSQAEYTVLEVFIDDQGKIINVSFRTLPGDFAKQESALRRSIESIKIR